MNIQQINQQRILDLINVIENKTGKMFHEVYPDLEQQCLDVLSGKTKGLIIINKLSKLIDEMDMGE